MEDLPTALDQKLQNALLCIEDFESMPGMHPGARHRQIESFWVVIPCLQLAVRFLGGLPLQQHCVCP